MNSRGKGCRWKVRKGKGKREMEMTGYGSWKVRKKWNWRGERWKGRELETREGE